VCRRRRLCGYWSGDHRRGLSLRLRSSGQVPLVGHWLRIAPSMQKLLGCAASGMGADRQGECRRAREGL